MIYGLSCIEEGKLALGGGVKHLFFFLLKEVSSCGGMFYREKTKLMEFFPSSNELVLVFKEIVNNVTPFYYNLIATLHFLMLDIP